ncbi:MAG: acyl carrier protein [Lachnospiraceae bacterium]
METREEILEAMATRLSQVIGKAATDLTEDTAFADLDLKSVNYSQLTTYLEDECDVEIPFMEFRRKATLGEAADYIVALIEG